MEGPEEEQRDRKGEERREGKRKGVRILDTKQKSVVGCGVVTFHEHIYYVQQIRYSCPTKLKLHMHDHMHSHTEYTVVADLLPVTPLLAAE